MEKTLLIGNQAIEISRLKKQIELMEKKINELWLEDFISSTLKWEARKNETSIAEFEALVRKEKEDKKGK